MRVIYYTQAFFSDCDFPLIRELQKKMGDSVRVYIPIQTFRRRSGIIDIKKLKKNVGIYKASKYAEFAIYRDYVDLNRIYIINLPDERRRIQDVFIWLYAFIHMMLFRPQIFHFNWQLEGRERWLYKLPAVKYMTVHDPISHSSVKSDREEISRLLAFSYVNRFVLLSDVLKKEFSQNYGISESKIDISRMGEFSHLRIIDKSSSNYDYQYILFFGQILSYKGLEYLCEAMTRVHTVLPNLHLIIAGRGKIYFDYSKYEKLSYFHLLNDFIPIVELAQLLQNALFAVCPYKDATQSGVVQTAFSCETPMIVTNVGALPKAVINGETGMVIPPCDVDALGKAITDLASNPSKLELFKNNIIKKWRPSMEWSSIAKKYIESYNKYNEA